MAVARLDLRSVACHRRDYVRSLRWLVGFRRTANGSPEHFLHVTALYRHACGEGGADSGNASWRALLAGGRIPIADSDYFYPATAAADASSVFGVYYSDMWSGVVAIDRQGAVTRIRQFDEAPQSSQILSAAFDGRWLVWTESHHLQLPTGDDIRAWDSTTGEVLNIASRSADGKPSFGFTAAFADGQVAWSAGGQNAPEVLHLYRLADRQDRVLTSGSQAFQPLSFWQGNIYALETNENATRQYALIDAATGEQLRIPPELAAVDGLSLASSPGQQVWSEGGLIAVRRGSDNYILSIALQFPNADIARMEGVQFLQSAGNLVLWFPASGGMMVADLRSGSFTKVDGSIKANGDAIAVARPVGPIIKSEDPLTGTHFEIDLVDATKLPPLPGCPA